jgi:hypothetical protein
MDVTLMQFNNLTSELAYLAVTISYESKKKAWYHLSFEPIHPNTIKANTIPQC